VRGRSWCGDREWSRTVCAPRSSTLVIIAAVGVEHAPHTQPVGLLHLAFGFGEAVKRTVFGCALLLFRACLPLTEGTQVDDVGHQGAFYFLRKASSETTSAPLASAFSASSPACRFFAADPTGSTWVSPPVPAGALSTTPGAVGSRRAPARPGSLTSNSSSKLPGGS